MLQKEKLEFLTQSKRVHCNQVYLLSLSETSCGEMVNNSIFEIKVSFVCCFSLVQHDGSIYLPFLSLSALREDPKTSAKLFW